MIHRFGPRIVFEHLPLARGTAVRGEEETGPVAPPGTLEAAEAGSALGGALFEPDWLAAVGSSIRTH